MRQKTNSLLTVRVSWWAFGVDECLSCWRNSGRFGVLGNCFSEVGEVLFVNTQLKVGIRWEQQVSTQALSTAIGLSKTFLKRKLQGDAIPWGKNKYTMIYGSEISQLRYISNFSKNGSCSHEDNWRCFFGFQGENHWFNRDFFNVRLQQVNRFVTSYFSIHPWIHDDMFSPNFFNENYWFDFWFKIVKDT